MPNDWVSGAAGQARRLVGQWLPLLDRHRGARQFVKFCLVGFSNVVVYFGLYLMLTRAFSWYFLAASIASFLVAVTWSFCWNRRWTFRVAGGSPGGYYRKFVLTNLASGVMSNAALYVLVERFLWHDIAANVVIIGFTTFWNFSVTKFWAFRR